MAAKFQLAHFLLLSGQVLWIANAQNPDGIMQGHPPVIANVVTNSGGMGGGIGSEMGGLGAGMAVNAGGDLGFGAGMAVNSGGGGDLGFRAGLAADAGGVPGGFQQNPGGEVFDKMAQQLSCSPPEDCKLLAADLAGESGLATSKAPENVKYCYAQGPLLPESLLPKPKYDASLVDVGTVSCEEVVGYLMGLFRFYDRKCSRMGDKCPNKYKYAVSWYNTVAKQEMTKCNIAVL